MHRNQSDEQPMEEAFKYLRISVVENSTIFLNENYKFL